MLKNKSTLIALSVLLALIGGLTYLKQKPTSTTNTTPSNTATKTSPTNKLEDWFNGRKTAICQIKDDRGHTTTVYIKGNKMRVEGYSQHSADPNETGFYIQDDQYIYTWTNTKKVGFKFPLEDNQEEANETNNKPNPKEMMQAWTNMNYQCQAKNLPDSLFTPPSDVKFQDMSQLIKTFENMSNNPEAVQQQLQDLQGAFGGE